MTDVNDKTLKGFEPYTIGRIEYRPLTADERRTDTHFCNRCETVQKRYEIHHCVATEKRKAAKAAGKQAWPEPITARDANNPRREHAHLEDETAQNSAEMPDSGILEGQEC